MSTYRYSDIAAHEVARTAAKRGVWGMLAAAVAGLGVFVINGLASDTAGLIALCVVGAIAAFGIWRQWKSAAKNGVDLVKSIEVELNPEALEVRHPMCPITIRLDEVTQLRYMSDGIVVQTKDLRRSAKLGSELEGFDELTRGLEQWVPAGVPRGRSSSSANSWAWMFVIAVLGLMVASMTVTAPAIAAPLCILTALLLLGCIVSVWSSKAPAKTKLLMLFALLPLLSFATRAYLLATGAQ